MSSNFCRGLTRGRGNRSVTQHTALLLLMATWPSLVGGCTTGRAAGTPQKGYAPITATERRPKFAAGKETAVAVIFDTTLAGPTGQQFAGAIREMIDRRRLNRKSPLAIVSCNASPRIVWSGKAGDLDEARSALDKVMERREESTGTDVAGAVELGRWWIGTQRDRGITQLLIAGCSDLTPDPVKEGRRIRRTFAPLDRVRWEPADADLNVVFFGVQPDIARAAGQAWGRKVQSLNFHEPGHKISLEEDFGLRSPSLR